VCFQIAQPQRRIDDDAVEFGHQSGLGQDRQRRQGGIFQTAVEGAVERAASHGVPPQRRQMARLMVLQPLGAPRRRAVLQSPEQPGAKYEAQGFHDGTTRRMGKTDP
jgi:hypothetical protein